MRVGVVDVGGNTARLLVASAAPEGLQRIAEERVVLGLGAEIERRGRISRAKLAETHDSVAELCSRAHEAGCARIEVIVTSPGRQTGNRDALERTLATRGATIRFVSAEEEARLAHAGAVACAPVDGDVAVCDVGGGSTEIAIGPARATPTWCRSLELGSLRLTHRFFSRLPPSRRATEAAQTEVSRALGALTPGLPQPRHALATGGTARALRKLVGRTLGPDELAEALGILRRTTPRRLSRRFELPPWRAAVLPAGAIVLSEVQARLDVPLVVAAGGVREGAALRLLVGQVEAA